MKSTVEHIEIPVRYEAKNHEIEIDFDLVSLAKTAVKIKLLGEVERLEQLAKTAN